MACLITYELLSGEKKDYRPFFGELEACSRRVLPTAWIAKSKGKEELMRTLWPLMHEHDRLMVAEIASVVATNTLA